MTDAPPRRTAPRGVLIGLALLADVVLVLAFTVLGRASHDSDVLAGLWSTAWPFLGGLAAGWLIARAWRAPIAPLRTGLIVWAATLIGGMLLRAASGQGTALAFIVVAALTLVVALVGWRTIATLVTRRRSAA